MSHALFDLTGRIALVTGSSRGIGRAVATGLAEAGATVVLNGRNSERLSSTAAELRSRVGADRVRTSAFDVTDPSAVDEAVGAVESEIGPLDILVNNAGFQHRQPMLELAPQDWDAVLRTDLTSAFLVGRSVASRMVARRRGKIVNICSVQTALARPSIAPYAAAKAGLAGLTRAMCAEWAGYDIQVNGLAPGYVETELTAPLVADEAFTGWITGRTPAGRWGRIEDLVGPAVWLAGSGSDFVNGQVIFVDGGMTAVV
ncbi:KR domain-containing protein [Actinoalloteichus sp. AHMU CJ021]|uniref:Gluconate 5-dehydrogenase n=1 Tax=Actinoalloteichus caeruleus DSM 43889 TaxID=1120930 RepID=A0ABT1JLR2_ACTCY|nr:SDR family NAD(P)-dependent oxidoreductase [Actinoalloteichus caeruleus]AUS79203.1 KR domain-containing protein [Actinoalloteichus sp. AHMU CJ021]MCP2333456.1 gluconate 5-dehydrogenase [Actinoalloteichus caeruleus DSM 43889]